MFRFVAGVFVLRLELKVDIGWVYVETTELLIGDELGDIVDEGGVTLEIGAGIDQKLVRVGEWYWLMTC